MLAATWGTGEVLWSILWFFLFVLWIWLVIRVFMDIARSRDLSGWGKALWVLGIIILPFLGVLLYLIVNGDKMHQRDADDARAADQATQAYIKSVAGSGASQADQLSQLAGLHESGALTDSEYEKAKDKVVNG